MKSKPQLRAWDSDAILSWLLEEDGKWQEYQGVIHEAEQGRVLVVVSSLAIAEVLMLRGHDHLPPERRQKVRDFFEHEWIKVRQVDRVTAETAQDLVWDHGVTPKDAIHVVTALRARVSCLDTFDGNLIAKSGQMGNPPLKICRPDVPYPAPLFESTANAT